MTEEPKGWGKMTTAEQMTAMLRQSAAPPRIHEAVSIPERY